MDRELLRSVVRLALSACLLALAPGAARAQLDLRDSVTMPEIGQLPRTLTIVRLEFSGLSRTPRTRAEAAAGLSLPAPATPEVIQAAVERLRASRLFAAVDVHTRAGEAAGQVVLVFEVSENRPNLRFGLGYEDYSSWYLIPAQLNADNLTGHGEALSLGARVGYRVTGLDLAIRRPGTRSARDFWELRLRAEGLDRIYWLDSVETRHRLDRGGVDLRMGHAFGPAWSLENWLALETTDVDSNASVYSDRASRDVRKGDVVPFGDLPFAIRRDVRTRGQSRLGLAVLYDRRSGSGLETRGVWARLSGEGAFSSQGEFGSWQFDLRGYRPLGPDLQLAARVRAASLSSGAPFYERYNVGGLYTVRGYPSQSLSPPEGSLNLGAGSLELRSVWWGPASDPRFAGIAFVDGAAGWSHAAPSLRDVSYGAGFGFRARVPWLGHLGIDIARPLSPSPVREAFHVNGSIGWAF